MTKGKWKGSRAAAAAAADGKMVTSE